jgi:hypothetical protein
MYKNESPFAAAEGARSLLRVTEVATRGGGS